MILGSRCLCSSLLADLASAVNLSLLFSTASFEFFHEAFSCLLVECMGKLNTQWHTPVTVLIVQETLL